MPKFGSILIITFAATFGVSATAEQANHSQVADQIIEQQRAMLDLNAGGGRFGPQSPRDLDQVAGHNPRKFGAAPPHAQMNLCNIHFHESAEHRGGEFTKYAGNGDGKGYGTGYQYSGTLSAQELAPVGREIGGGKHGDLEPGDTIEVHYVHTTAQTEPGPTLESCLSDALQNPQLRVEAQVFVLVNDRNAGNFNGLAALSKTNGLHQAPNIPGNTGTPVEYAGSTTGPGYNEQGSQFQVTWSVRPKVMKVDILSVDVWLKDNVFAEDHAHGVRNLVLNPALLSNIETP